GIEDHRAGTVLFSADPELAFEYVPDLREIVLVQRVITARFIAHDARVGLGRSRRIRMEQHLPGLPWPADRLPLAVIAVNEFGRLMLAVVVSVHHYLLQCGTTDRSGRGSSVPCLSCSVAVDS